MGIKPISYGYCEDKHIKYYEVLRYNHNRGQINTLDRQILFLSVCSKNPRWRGRGYIQSKVDSKDRDRHSNTETFKAVWWIYGCISHSFKSLAWLWKFQAVFFTLTKFFFHWWQKAILSCGSLFLSNDRRHSLLYRGSQVPLAQDGGWFWSMSNEMTVRGKNLYPGCTEIWTCDCWFTRPTV